MDGNKNQKYSRKATTGCSIYEQCGGCLGQEEPYEKTLAGKQGKLKELLGPFCVPEPIIGMDSPCHYKNKAQAVFAHDREGKPYCGIMDEKTHKVVPVEHCLIENEKASAIILSIRDMLKSFKIKIFDEVTGNGLLRHVFVRTGLKSGEIMVVLVLSSLIMPSKNNFVKALRAKHPEITTIIINENYKQSKAVFGSKEAVVFGPGFILDTLNGKTFRIGAKSFYPTNPVQTEVLYQKAVSYAELAETDTILDAYCGIGAISLLASGQVKKVIGVDFNPDAVRDAVSNAKRNRITNIDYYTKDAGEFMNQVAEESAEEIDVVFMNPPKSGSDEEFMSPLLKINPKKVVYISCNPITFARDLEYLCSRNYKVKRAVGVDVFPWTKGMEAVCLLVKKGY